LKRRSDPRSAAALLALAGWMLFAFAGELRWTTIPFVAGALVVAWRERPAILAPPYRVLDAALLAWLLLAALMVVPLPARVRLELAPASAPMDRALYLDATADPTAAPARPLSVDPFSTTWALVVGGAL